MTARAPDHDLTAIAAQIAGVTIQVTCECGEQLCHEIECEEGDFGGWVKREAAPLLQDRVDKAVKDAADDVAAVKAGKVE